LCSALPRTYRPFRLVAPLYKEGFRGSIFATPGTIDLCKIMLADSAHIQESDLTYVNKRRKKRGENALEPLYDIQDVEGCLSQFNAIDYHNEVSICDEVKLLFTDAGHIIGSAVVNLTLTKTEQKKSSPSAETLADQMIKFCAALSLFRNVMCSFVKVPTETDCMKK
jgi:hypothetical protein